MPKWYKGDTHLHTTNSDGKFTKQELINKCKKIGLDFAIITDHNYNSVEKSYDDGEIIVIQGQELTDYLGHINVWGKKVPAEAPYNINSHQDYLELVDKCKKAGSLISLNHPFCSNCPFRTEKDDFPFDTVEVWNTIQHSDNIKNMQWWSEQLLQGKKIMAVGGSDYHRDYASIPLLAMPTTYVLADEKSPEAILRALKQGRCFVTNSPKSSNLFLSVGDVEIGGRITLDDCDIAEIVVTKLKKGHKVLIYNNDKIIFTFIADKYYKEFTAKVKIQEKGFIRAQIDYTLNPLLSRIFAIAEHTFLGSRGVKINNRKMPELFWAFTNPIWIE